MELTHAQRAAFATYGLCGRHRALADAWDDYRLPNDWNVFTQTTGYDVSAAGLRERRRARTEELMRTIAYQRTLIEKQCARECTPRSVEIVQLPNAPLVLDAYCRMGGSSYGYRLAGFRVVGVDKKDCSAGYAGDEFVQGDAIEFIRRHGHKFHLIHTGPPCQGQIRITKANRKRKGWKDDHVNLIPATRAALEETGRPYVIENGPSEHLRADLTMCGLTFGLPVFRHRSMELGGWSAPQPPHIGPLNHRGRLTIGWRHGCLRTVEPSLCPKHERWCKGDVYGVYGEGGGKPSVADAQRALGIDWMTDIKDLNEAIPPAYTHYLGVAFRRSEMRRSPLLAGDQEGASL